MLEDIEHDQPSERIVIIAPDGGEPLKSFDLPKTARTSSLLKSTPDGRHLAVGDFRGGSANVWTVGMDNKNEMKPVTDFNSEKIFDFAWSADGKKLAVVRGIRVSDVVLITGMK